MLSLWSGVVVLVPFKRGVFCAARARRYASVHDSTRRSLALLMCRLRSKYIYVFQHENFEETVVEATVLMEVTGQTFLAQIVVLLLRMVLEFL